MGRGPAWTLHKRGHASDQQHTMVLNPPVVTALQAKLQPSAAHHLQEIAQIHVH